MQWHMPIGYKVVDGKITICEEQRKIVEQIFTDYDSGVAAGRIAQNLKGRNICNAKGKCPGPMHPLAGYWKPKLPWHRILSAAHRRGTV